ncbi:hypothetical protein NDU88_004143 [Pleurodeles waltl]|uniref:Peptidase S1 domain-containing protein n=1 Tax=Pleurodeles waltl TaxID=8319 RepID=A0AAV7PK64_PLEWA|nr:hypothetical protein NDU88_004143 [Pleurodeles waltl]
MSHVVTRSISNIMVHEQFRDYLQGNDIVLFQLTEPVVFNEYIQPICLPLANHKFRFGSLCWSTGWGYINGESSLPYPRTLQKVEMELIKWNKCNCIFNLHNISGLTNIIQPGMICAGSQDGERGICYISQLVLQVHKELKAVTLNKETNEQYKIRFKIKNNIYVYAHVCTTGNKGGP